MALSVNAILIIVSLSVSLLLGVVLGYPNNGEALCELKGRIGELGDKSTQLLMFLSFGIAAIVLLGYASAGGPGKLVSDKIVQSGALRWWVSAIFPVLAGVLPLKEFGRDNLRWYRIVRWLKFWLLWAAILHVAFGAYKFFRAI